MAFDKEDEEWEDIPAEEEWEDIATQNGPPGLGEVAARSMGQATSLGFIDELAGTFESPKGAIKKIAHTWTPMDFKGDKDVAKYIAGRNAWRNRDKEAEHEYPELYNGLNFAGTIGASLIPGVGLSKSTKYLPSLAQSAKFGAILGLGNSERESAVGQAFDAGVGALGGAAGESIGRGASMIGGKVAKTKPVQKVIAWLDDMAEKRAFKQAGAMLKDERAATHQGRLNKTGRLLIDEDVVTPAGSVERIARKAESKLDETGARLGKAEEALDASRAAAAREGVDIGIDTNVVADRIEREIIAELADDPALGTLVPMLRGHVERFRALSRNGKAGFKKAGDMKRNYDKLVNYEKEQPIAKEYLKRMRGILNDEIEKEVGGLLSKGDHPELYQAWLKDKERYGLLHSVWEMAQDKALRNQANRAISPSDYGMMATGAVIGSQQDGLKGVPGGAAALFIANRLGRSYGSGAAARGANRFARFIEGGGKTELGRRAAPIFSNMVTRHGVQDNSNEFEDVPVERAPQSLEVPTVVDESPENPVMEAIKQRIMKQQHGVHPSGGLMNNLEEMRGALPSLGAKPVEVQQPMQMGPATPGETSGPGISGFATEEELPFEERRPPMDYMKLLLRKGDEEALENYERILQDYEELGVGEDIKPDLEYLRKSFIDQTGIEPRKTPSKGGDDYEAISEENNMMELLNEGDFREFDKRLAEIEKDDEGLAEYLKKARDDFEDGATLEKPHNPTEAAQSKIQGTKYEQMFQDAMQRGADAVQTMHFLLMQSDPEFQELMKSQQ